jgi:hypothetical protein
LSGIATHEFWISKGVLVERPKGLKGETLSERQLLQQKELVKVEVGPTGTTLKWVMFAANWTSLYFAISWIRPFAGPYTLSFFNSGWFEEQYDRLSEAEERIEHLIPKSDIRFSTRTYTRAFDPGSQSLPSQLKHMWSTGSVDESNAVHCAIDTERRLTHVEHVGPNSALAKVWGISPVSFPCLSGHSYDRIVSESYYEVVRTGRPTYNHVLAAMVHPGGEVRWFGYHRIVFPNTKRSGNFPRVTVACEVAKVDIPIL